jgi:hypothetical protein
LRLEIFDEEFRLLGKIESALQVAILKRLLRVDQEGVRVVARLNGPGSHSHAIQPPESLTKALLQLLNLAA